MKEIHGTYNKKLVLLMGFFDSVHIGHRKLFDTAKVLARKIDAKNAVMTFDNNPFELFKKDSKLVYTFEERKTLFSSCGIDFCLPFTFNEEFKNTHKDEFLSKLFSHFNIGGVVCGYDYRFGFKCEGDVESLRKFCLNKGAEFIEVEPVLIENERVSTTAIKRLLSEGDIQKANLYLGESFFISGNVENGRGIGKTIGFPTANLSVNKSKILPLEGVYSSNVIIENKEYKAVTNIGASPTFNIDAKTVETHIINFNDNLYGKTIKIKLNRRLREIKKFENIDELKNQLNKDITSI